MRAGKIAGIPFFLNNWFLVLIALFSMIGLGGKCLVLFIFVLCHEIGHVIMARAQGFKVSEIEILPFGGVARIDDLNTAGTTSEVTVAAAGPLVSLVLAAVFYGIYINFPIYIEETFFMAKVNMMLGLFNLIPVLPLDGGRIARALLAKCLGYSQATSWIIVISKVICIMFIGYVGYEWIAMATVNITLIMVVLFVLVSIKQEAETAALRMIRVLAQKKVALRSRGAMRAGQFAALRDTPVSCIARLLDSEQYYTVIIIDEEFRTCGMLTETQIWEAMPLKGIHAEIGELI